LNKEISFILPVYNNYESCELGLERLFSSPKFGEITNNEFILVDDGSDDFLKFKELAKKFKCIYLRLDKNTGKGAALALAFQHASGSYIVFTDSDMPFSIENLLNISRLIIEDDFDLIIGDRTKRMENKKKVVFLRYYLGRVFNHFSSRLLGFVSQDSQCGLKAFKGDIGRKLFKNITVNRFSIDAEILFRASYLNLSVHSVPVEINKNGKSSISIFSDGFLMVYDIFKIKLFSIKKWSLSE
jgi:glycosyltransferase involved in cell wall biosynthesis